MDPELVSEITHDPLVSQMSPLYTGPRVSCLVLRADPLASSGYTQVWLTLGGHWRLAAGVLYTASSPPTRRCEGVILTFLFYC